MQALMDPLISDDLKRGDVSADADATGLELYAGSTAVGQTEWQEYRSRDGQLLGIYVDVDTSAGRFSETPKYFTSIGGDGWHWQTVGATSIYNPTARGFRVYLCYANGEAPTPEFANDKKWHICWVGIRDVERVGSTAPGATPWQE